MLVVMKEFLNMILQFYWQKILILKQNIYKKLNTRDLDTKIKKTF